MLKDIKQKSSGIAGGIIIIVLAILVCLGGVQFYSSNNSRDFVVAKVNGIKIRKSQLDYKYDSYRESLAQRVASTDVPISVLNKLRKNILENLITSQVNTDYASTQGMIVPDYIRDGYVVSQDMFKVNNTFSTDKYKLVLNSIGLDENSYLKQVSESMLQRQIEFGIENSSFLLPTELTSISSMLNEKRSIEYASLELNSYLKPRVSSDEISTYYKLHRAEFKVPEKIKISYVLIDKLLYAEKFVPTNEQLKDFYEKHKPDFSFSKKFDYTIYSISASNNSDKDSYKDLIVEVRDSVLNENTLVKQFNTYIQKNNNNVGITKRIHKNIGRDNIEVEQVASSLYGMHDNDVVSLQSKDELILLKLDRVNYIPFNKLSGKQKKTLSSVWRNKIVEARFPVILDEVTDLAYADDDLTAISKLISQPIQVSGYFQEKTGGDGVTKNKNVIKYAFSEDVLKEKLNSPLIKIGENQMIVFRLNDKIQSHTPSVNDVKSDIYEIISTNKLKEQLNIDADKILNDLTDDDANTHNLVPMNNISRTGIINRLGMEIRDEVFQMPYPTESTPSVKKIQLKNGNIIVARFVTSNHDKPYLVKNTTITQDYNHHWGVWDYDSFEHYIRTQATIEYTADYTINDNN